MNGGNSAKVAKSLFMRWQNFRYSSVVLCDFLTSVLVFRYATVALCTMLCQENELCLWHINDVSSGSAYDESEDMQIEDEPELLGKVAHRGDVTDLLVSYMHITVKTGSVLSSRDGPSIQY